MSEIMFTNLSQHRQNVVQMCNATGVPHRKAQRSSSVAVFTMISTGLTSFSKTLCTLYTSTHQL